MNKLFEQLVQLLKIKSLITIIAMIVFAILALNGTIDVDKVMQIVIIIITFYFAKNDNKDEIKDNAEINNGK